MRFESASEMLDRFDRFVAADGDVDVEMQDAPASSGGEVQDPNLSDQGELARRSEEMSRWDDAAQHGRTDGTTGALAFDDGSDLTARVQELIHDADAALLESSGAAPADGADVATLTDADLEAIAAELNPQVDDEPEPVWQQPSLEVRTLGPRQRWLDGMQGPIECACPSCAKDVWSSLQPHVRIQMPSSPDEMLTDDQRKSLLYSCDLQELMVFFDLQWNLMPEIVTPVQFGMVAELTMALDSLEEDSIAGTGDSSALWPVQGIAHLLNSLLFRGVLAEVDYRWKEDMPYFGQTLDLGNGKCCIEVMPPTVRIHDLGAEPKTAIRNTLGTIIHEQIHAFFGLYLCDGGARCGSKAVCSFLRCRNVDMYPAMRYKGKIWGHSTYWGHGPVFVHIARVLDRLMEDLLDMSGFDMVRGGPVECTCGCILGFLTTGTGCMSHCTHDWEVQKADFLKSFEAGELTEYAGLDEGEEGADGCPM